MNHHGMKLDGMDLHGMKLDGMRVGLMRVGLMRVGLMRVGLMRVGQIKLGGRKMRGREPHTLAGAYAMDAISAPDRARFESHLARCEECAQEIASLREATARLATAAAATPPSGLKDRVMAVASMTRQQPPSAHEADSVLGSRTAGARLGRWLGSLAWRGRLAVAAGAVIAVVVLGAAVVFGVANGSMRQQLSHAQASSQQVAAVLTARDATMMTGPVAGGGTVTIVMSHSMRALVFTAAGLHALPATRGYELWLIGPGGDRPVGMFAQVSHDMTGPVIASGLRSGDHLALTAEPAGGTSRPTTPMMLDLAL
jgi:anti-sigma-K factor RskA